ncbi:MAG: hypothetical protein FWG82_01885 [Oscillospiraceae bacterium]|nr:hypothetical protein [Oscillospiraceae bacterium]
MFDFYREHWYLIPILLALLALTVFLLVKAARGRGEINRSKQTQLARLQEQKDALNAYRRWRNSGGDITDKQLFMGYALEIQSKMQTAEDLASTFGALSEDEKQIYALYFALEDEVYPAPSHFFKEFGKPLTCAARDGFQRFADSESAAAFAEIYAAHDQDDENASFVPTEIAELDAVIANSLDRAGIYKRVASVVESLIRLNFQQKF